MLRPRFSPGAIVPAFLGALAALALGGFGLVAASPAGAVPTSDVIYNSTLSPLPGNIPSYGGEAYSFNEIGNEVNLAPSTEPLTDVTVTMSSWACETGGWTGPTPCTTTPGQTYAVPITFNIYNPGATPGTVGSLITTETQSFNIPYRPSANSVTNPGGTQCSGAPNGESEWYDTATGTCYNGLADNVRFDFTSKNVTLPSTVVYGISYDTDNHGPNPIGGTTSPTDSLNVAFTTESTDVSVGSDANPGNIYVNSASATNTNLFCSTVTPDVFMEASNGCVSGSPPTNDIPAVQFATATSHGPSQQTGYWTVASDGGVFSYGPQFYGSMGDKHLNAPVVAMASTNDAGGYWEVASDGGIFAFGDANFHGSMGGQHLNKPVVGMAPNLSGKGYWLAASDGGIFAFGDATYLGSMGGQQISAPIVGIAATPTGNGYWEVGADGAVYPFGDAQSYGSMAGKHLNAPIVGITGTTTGKGYWLAASDGGIFAFGDATYLGSMGGQHLNKPVVGIAGTPTGSGYTEVATDGGVFNFGDSIFAGSMGGQHLNKPMVGIAAPPAQTAA